MRKKFLRILKAIKISIFLMLIKLVLSNHTYAQEHTISGIDVVNNLHREVGISFQEKSSISRLTRSNNTNDFLTQDARHISEVLNEVYIGQSNVAGDLSVGKVISTAYSTINAMENIRDAARGIESINREWSTIIDQNSDFSNLRSTLNLDQKVNNLNEVLSGSEAVWSDFSRDLQFITADGLKRSVSTGGKIGLAITPAGDLLAKASSLTDKTRIASELQTAIGTAKNLQSFITVTNESLEILEMFATGQVDKLIFAEKIAKLETALIKSIPKQVGEGASIVNNIRGVIESARALSKLDNIAGLASRDDTSRIIVNLAVEDVSSSFINNVRNLIFDVGDITGASNRVSMLMDGLSETATIFARAGTDRKISEVYKWNDKLLDAQDELEIVRGSYQIYVQQHVASIGQKAEVINQIYKPVVMEDKSLCDAHDCSKSMQDTIDELEVNQDNTPEEVPNQETAVHKEEQASDASTAEEKKDPQAVKDAILENHADKEKKKTRKEEILANYNDKKEKQAEQDRIDRENEQLRKQREREAIEEQIAKLVAKQDINNNVVTDAEARIKEEKNQIAVSKYEDLEIVDKSLRSFRSELKKLSLRAGDKAELTKLQRERSTLIDGAKIVRQLQLKRLKVENLTRSQKIKLTLMGSALGYTSAGGKPVWQTVADNIRFTANKIISRVGSIDRTVARLNPLSPAEERKLKLVKQKEVELTNNKIKILNTIKRSEEKIQNYETELAKTRNEMRSNERTLTQLGYDLENYQAPNFTTSPRSDWANYDSPYDAIEVSDLTDEFKAEINAGNNNSTVGGNPGTTEGTAPTGNGQSFPEPGDTSGNSAGEQASGQAGEGDEEENSSEEGTSEDGDQGADSNNTDGTRTFDRITTNRLGTGVFNTDSLEPKDENNQIKLSSRIGGGSIKQIETFDASDYFYTKLGKWSAMAGTPSNFSHGGYFATIDGTPTTAIQSLSGSATYSGNIIGEFVKSDGFRDDARGLIELSVNFSNQSVDAQFQLGHNCSSTGGGGPSGCGTVSRVAKVTEPINDYLSSNGAGFGSHSDAARTSGESIVGIFGGANGQEIAGDVFLADNGGYYNGVFQSKRGDIEEENDKIHWTGSVSGLNQSSSSTHSFTTGGDIDQSPPNIGDTVTLDVTDPTSSTYQIAGTVEGKVEAKNQYLVGGVWTDSLNIKNSGTGQNTTFNRGYFIMGDQTPKSFINQRTGTATYSGEIGADYASPSTGVIYDSIEGSINLLADFNSKKVSGNLNMQGPNNFSANTTLDASFYDRGSDHVGYGGNLSGTDSFGGFDGVFYGPKSEETGGSFWYQNNNSGESVTGVYGTGLDSNDDDNGTVMVAMSTQTAGRYIIDDRLRMVENPGDQNSGFELGISPDRGGGSVLTSERFSLGEYSYTNWGRWKATNLSPETHLAGGYWVSGHVTPENVIHDKTGSASYSGKMIGDFVSFEGAREAAYGDIALNANFTSNIISGQMQWGHGGGAVSPLVDIYTGISGNGDFSMSSHHDSAGFHYGVNGQFIGSNAQEVGGASWMQTQEGSYNGVFRAKQ